MTAFLSLCRRIKRCICSCDEKIQFYTWILKKEETVLKDILKAGAKEILTEKIKEKINSGNWENCFNAADELIENDAALRFVETAAEQVNKTQLHVYITALTCLCCTEQLDRHKTLVGHQNINCKNFNCLKLFTEDSSSTGKTVSRGESICPSGL